MFFRFGRFTIQIVCSRKFELVLSDLWRNYLQTEETGECDAILHVIEVAEQTEESLDDGWTKIVCDGKETLFFSVDSLVLFSIQIETLPEDYRRYITITGSNVSDCKIGIQFGLLIALHRQCIGLHGVTLLCGEEIVILSAPTGTGKTTLAQLLEMYADAIIINGDFALLSVTEEGVVFEPTPFCGSSGRALNHRLKVNRIIFLKQSVTNQWEELTAREAMVHLMSNSFIPEWDGEASKIIQDRIVEMIPLLRVNRFSFAPNQDAAELLYNQLNV